MGWSNYFGCNSWLYVWMGVLMSTRNFGMVGKAYKTASEAFKDADYATAIERPESSDFSGIGAFLGALLFLAVFAYGFWLTIGRY